MRALVVALAVLLAAPAEAGDKPAAESLFRAGKEAEAAGRLEEACDRFAASQAAEASVGALLNLARCQERLKRTASAWRSFRAAASLAESAGQSERALGARGFAEALRSKLSWLEIEAPAGLELTLDGEAVVGSKLALDPGRHELVATAPGRRSWSKTIVVKETDRRQRVTVPVLEASRSDAAASASDGEVPPAAIAGYAVAGVGAAVLGVGMVLGLTALQDRNELERSESCAARRCSPEGLERLESVRTMAVASTVTVVVGAAGLVAGLITVIVAPEAAPEAASLAPTSGPGELGLGLSGRF